ncbi:hypothetical protein [uncultured Barnesiella sp.]|uniref:hypothetical protein n=1 Tax=uncultured Barnesiella sp. TaxID=584861 RepID=UPI0026017504|nr:hypothetical protein [uncultured Barnesiella sp.]
MKYSTFRIVLLMCMVFAFAACEEDQPTNVDTIWTRGLVDYEEGFEFLNKNIAITWNEGKIEGVAGRMTTFTDLGVQRTETIDLSAFGVPEEGESFCVPELGHLYFVHQAWESETRIQNHCGYFRVIEFLGNQKGVVILSSEYTPAGWNWIGQ